MGKDVESYFFFISNWNSLKSEKKWAPPSTWGVYKGIAKKRKQEKEKKERKKKTDKNTSQN